MRSPSGISPIGSGATDHFVHPWPTDETHLSLEQRTEFQRLLIAQGLMTGEPDGVIGPATLEAVKTYQRPRALGSTDIRASRCSSGYAAKPPPGPAAGASSSRPATVEPSGTACAKPAPAAAGQPANAGQE